MSTISDASAIGSEVEKSASRFKRLDEAYNEMLDALREKRNRIHEGGGAGRVAREHSRGKLTARERISSLLDDPDSFLEIGTFAGYEMYEDEGGCPAGGTVAGTGYVSGRLDRKSVVSGGGEEVVGG